ncbi:MAG: hypothetical protein QOH69_1035 [Actinomycetota bacterium]|jgi:hypothetical protein|nr:hypothetical protein [Actinomycetota bacterium]
MNSTDTHLLERYRAAAAVLADLPNDAALYAAASESALLEANQLFATSQVALRSGGAFIAGEIAHRSAPELGSQGLAQRSGHRTAEQFIKTTNGVTGRDAVTAVRVGSLMREAAVEGEVDLLTGVVATPTQPWLSVVTSALTARTISIEAADAIRAGLGAPNSAITTEQLADAARQLVEAARKLDPDALAREARAFRDELDVDGAALREEERRQKRSLRLYVQADGTTKLVWIMDPETAATVRDIYDRTTSPKLGGVRFVDPARQSLAEQIAADERSPEQIASDGFEQLLKLGADVNPSFLLGSGAPVVRLTATRTAFERGTGLARIEGQVAPVSISTVWRLTCEAGVAGVVLDENGYVLDFGREQRFFTRKQKEALAIMWGGCAFPGCQCPPSWTEAHHIVFWKRDGGKTDLADGILLCRYHHLLLHNNGWEIFRDDGGKYWLVPPPERDPNQTPIELVSKNLALRDLQREQLAS